MRGPRVRQRPRAHPQAYLSDPHRPGTRLYRGGDYGRWQPDGKLEFLGRRDTQVKIAGFRIEIGEIENTLLRVPGVRDGAVVVAERPGRGKQLTAFYGGPRPLDATVLRERLAGSLPAYMVPAAFHWCEELPLTANGKIDVKRLTALAAELEVAGEGYQAPRTTEERRVASAWSTVLGIPLEEVGRRDHFFDRGGTSLSAVRLVIALDRDVSLKDVTRHPVLADLAALLSGASAGETGLLQALTEPGGAGTEALVCIPYAGGNAVSFQPLATALRGGGLAVYAVELPGHDLAADGAAVSDSLAPMAEVVERVVEEITRLGLTRIRLWGHSSGAAFAVETARRLEERGVEVVRVVLAAQLIGDLEGRRSGIAELSRRSDGDIVAALSAAGGHGALGQLDTVHAERVAVAYRHDCLCAHRLPRSRPGEPARHQALRPGHGGDRRRRPQHRRFPSALPRLVAGRRAGRAARARRRRPLLPAHPSG